MFHHHQQQQQQQQNRLCRMIIFMILICDIISVIRPFSISMYHSKFSSVYGYVNTIQQHRQRSYQQYQSSLLLLIQQHQQRLSLLRLQQSKGLNEYDSNHNSDDTTVMNHQNENNQNNDIDLFDYFDPLLSPHSYPNGINKPTTDTSTTTTLTTSTTVTSVDSSSTSDISTDTTNRNNIISNDDFGWTTNRNDNNRSMKKSYQMKKPFGISLPTTEVDKDTISTTTIPINKEQIEQQQRPMIDVLTTFDPTLSPHLYTNGYVPDTIIGDNVQETKQQQQKYDSDIATKPKTTKTIGILLIDHGSRNDASNIRLEELAQLYQNQYYNNSNNNNNNNNHMNVIVQAVHMEIAKPSILDGLKSLLSYNNNNNDTSSGSHTTPIILSEIICHPYFLSPGRHVQSDIPQLIHDAIIQIQNDYTATNNNDDTTIQQEQQQQQYILPPIKITKPIGSQTNMMLNAIHTSIQETSEFIL